MFNDSMPKGRILYPAFTQIQSEMYAMMSNSELLPKRPFADPNKTHTRAIEAIHFLLNGTLVEGMPMAFYQRDKRK